MQYKLSVFVIAYITYISDSELYLKIPIVTHSLPPTLFSLILSVNYASPWSLRTLRKQRVAISFIYYPHLFICILTK